MANFDLLLKNEDSHTYLTSAEKHLKNVLIPIQKSFHSLTGENFIKKLIICFKKTGSPIFVNLDYNISEKNLNKSEKILEEMEIIVKSTASHVLGYKFNFQSMLTFLIAKRPKFVFEIKKYIKSLIGIEPLVWLDQKLGDIPNTNYQAADILYKLGFDAVHSLPIIGLDSSGAVQIAAERNEKKGVIHVINMTHKGYKDVKTTILHPHALNRLRRYAIGNKEYPVQIGKKELNVKIRAVGTIEPANRPYEIFCAKRDIYKNKILIFSIGIGIQGALPGCALYGGASAEGIGRFIFQGENGIDSESRMTEKAELCKKTALIALFSKYNNEQYPLNEIQSILKKYNPQISDETKEA